RSLERHRDVGAYALGVLDEAEAFRFEDHLMECPRCAAHVTEFGPAARQLMLYRRATPRFVHPMAQLFGTVEAVSGFTVRLRRAWQAERLPKLLLPHPGNGHPLRIGRDPANGLRLNHETVSRVHAELRRQGGLWILRDLGSTNGTTVNGRRVTGAAVVREGDQIGFGRVSFRLAAS
ncbi:FHA domain-containing protein, partial [Streptomyces sp. NPDC005921]